MRVALRTTTVKLIVFVVALGMSEAPGKVLHQMARGLATGEGWVWLPVALALWAATDAHLARQRLMPTLHGWELHLPVRCNRAPAGLPPGAPVGASAGPRAMVTLLWVLALVMGEPVQLRMLAAIPVMALGAGHALLPLQRLRTRPLGAMAVLLGGLPGWLTLAASAALVLVADASAGPLQRRRPTARCRKRTEPGPAACRYESTCAPQDRISHGRISPRQLPVTLAWFFVRNNALTDTQVGLGVRAGCGLGTALLMLELAGHLRAHRPPWGWSRSLPWSSRQRLLHDAAFLTASGLPVLAGALWLDPWAAVPLAALLPYCGLRLAASLRPAGRATSPALEPGGWWKSLACTLAVAVTVWSAWLLLLLLPWAVRAGEQRERRLKVGLWLEREHAASGDPIS